MSVAVEQAETLHEAVVAALSELAEIVADETVNSGTYSYRFAPLSTIMRTVRPILAGHGLAVSQLVSSTLDELVIGTTLVHRSGLTYGSGHLTMRMPSQPQAAGSLITYMRRYQLVALLGLAIDDDDARAAQPAPRSVGEHRAPPRRSSAPSVEQTGYVMSLFGDLGLSGAENRDARLSLTSDILAHDVTSYSEVTAAEASTLIDALIDRLHRHDEDDPSRESGYPE